MTLFFKSIYTFVCIQIVQTRFKHFRTELVNLSNVCENTQLFFCCGFMKSRKKSIKVNKKTVNQKRSKRLKKVIKKLFDVGNNKTTFYVRKKKTNPNRISLEKEYCSMNNTHTISKQHEHSQLVPRSTRTTIVSNTHTVYVCVFQINFKTR